MPPTQRSTDLPGLLLVAAPAPLAGALELIDLSDGYVVSVVAAPPRLTPGAAMVVGRVGAGGSTGFGPDVDRAVALAIKEDIHVDRADAGVWLTSRLIGRLPEGVSILYHSIAWQYFAQSTKDALAAVIERTAGIAEPTRRFAWVRFEHDRILGYPEDGYSVDVVVWPGGQRRRIARTDPHARWVEII
jgi:hypothetical protein